MKKSTGKSRFAGLVGQSKRDEGVKRDEGTTKPLRARESALTAEDVGKRARGHVQLSALVPPDVRDDLKVALALSFADHRDLSELITDLVSDWLDGLPSNFQNIRPSRRQNK